MRLVAVFISLGLAFPPLSVGAKSTSAKGAGRAEYNSQDPNLANHAPANRMGSSALPLPGANVASPIPQPSLRDFYSAHLNTSFGSVVPQASQVSRFKTSHPAVGSDGVPLPKQGSK